MHSDDRRPIDRGPEPGSKLVGKAQGVYGSAAQTETGLLMVYENSIKKYDDKNINTIYL